MKSTNRTKGNSATPPHKPASGPSQRCRREEGVLEKNSQQLSRKA